MRIGVVAPAKSIDAALADRLRTLAANSFPGVELVIDPQCYLSDGHFAGPDAVRAAAFLAMANDPAIDAIWFARGGYGSGRILAAVMPQLGPAAARKAYLGYSDMGFLMGALYARRLGRVAHGPMPGDLAREGGEKAVARALAWLARGDRAALEGGLGQRPAAAFNLAILAGLCGTPWLPDLADHVLLIEDVSEPLYRIDRLLFQLAHATQLKGVAGVRLGRVSDIQPNEPPWREPLATMLARWCAEMGVPFLGAADIGHDVDNKVVPFGLV
ncbi:MAG: LD-carboxypeptidase [Proteobacteria bacterium SG_bin5]|nr:MAG: LD-carboxypeptidase [Proteobacteria bacterium SG_bin5]